MLREDIAREIYNKFQNEFYLLKTEFCSDKIRELEIQIMFDNYKCRIQKTISTKIS